MNGRPIGGGIASGAVSRASVAGVVGQVVIGIGITDRDSVTGVGSRVEPGSDVACDTENRGPIGTGTAGGAVDRASIATVVGEVIESV